MVETASASPASVPEGWPNLVAGDYSVGVIRLVTLVLARVNHLLFASVELLPAEMPVPPRPRGGGWFQNFGANRICLGRTVLKLTEAINWYEALKRGEGVVPGMGFRVSTARLAPEPDCERFTVPRERPPFSPAWHGRPRLHRLVPMEALAEPVETLRDGATEVEAFIRAREWLRQHVHFDLLTYDEWLGSAVLIAPNPLLRDCGARIADRSGSGETIEVGGMPRRRANLSTLKLTVEEMRAGAPAWRAEGAPNPLGRFRAPARSQVAAVRHDLFCSVRGLLDHEAPGFFFRSVSVSAAHVAQGRPRQVAPPRRTPLAKSRTVHVHSAPVPPPEPPLTALRQLEQLQLARERRTGDSRPADTPLVPQTVHVLENDREGTVALIRDLIASARRDVLFVDPYLDADDLQEFATAARYQGVAIRGLINPRPDRNRRADANGDLFGDYMLQKIQELRNPAQEFGDIDIRVSKFLRLHDRFLQIDDVVWHSGHSFSQVGKGEISLMTRVPEPVELREVLEEAFAEAEPFEIYWNNRPVPAWSLRQEVGHLLRRLANWIEQPRSSPPQDSENV